MKIKPKCLLWLFLASFVAINCHAQEVFYVVKKGETLSEILEKLHLLPVYTKRGSLQKILELNPRKKPSHGNRIYPGEKLLFSPEQSELLANAKFIKESGEVTFESKPIEKSIASVEPTIEESLPLTASEEEKKSESRSELTLRVSGAFVRVEGNDKSDIANGTLGSSASPGLDIIWSSRLNDKISMDVGAFHQKVRTAESTKKDITNENQNLSSLFLGTQYQLNSKWTGEAKIGQADQIFFRALDLSTVKVEKVSVPYLQGGARYNIAGTETMVYALRWALRLHSPVSTDYYKAQTGYGGLASFLVEHNFGKYTLLSEAFYVRDIFPTKEIDFTKSEAGVSFGVRYKFGH